MAEVVGLVASVAGIADISFKIIGIVKEYVGEVRGAKDDIRNLVTELSECYMVAKEMKKLTDDPKAKALLSSRELAPTIEITLATLKRLQTELEASSKTSLSSFKWPLVKKSVEACVKPLARTVEKVRDMMQVDQTRLLLNAEHRIVIDKLQVAEGAAFNSHAQEHSTACFPDTRVELLEQIYQWIEGTYSRAVFWLNGMAGTGKSTISQRIARSQSAAGQLGATFFFKRGEEDRSSLDKFMSTLAQQLAHHIPGVGPLIKAAIDEDPTIGGKLIQQQFDRLIIEPLASLLASDTDTIPARIVFVVDALDECGKDEDIRLLIQVITSATNLPSRLRFFLTSRPALPVLGSFREAKEAHHVLILHDIQESIVEHDLEVFFRVQFGSIRSSFNAASDSNKLPDDWPGDNTVRELVSRSKPLFIFAATLCRYVRNRKGGNPKALLARYLESKATGSHLSQMYHHILKSQLDDDEPSLKPDIINDFILVVGSIVILAEPLGMKSLVSLLGDKHRDTVSDRLRQLHSVLRVPPDDSPMRLLHLSFGDYLLGRDSQTEEARLFHVEQDHAHRTVAKKSIRLMRKCPLRQNIAVLSFPGMKTSDVDPQQLATAIPPALRYACRYWIHHWTSSHFHEQHGALIHDFLKVHLLHWWEAMSLLGHLREAMNALRSLLSWIQVSKDPSHSLSEILELLTDVIRFLRSNFYVMEHTPLQIYSSALALSPANSIVKRSFASCISSWLTLQPPVRKSWNACLAVLECQGGLHSMAFSRNSRRLAGASYSSIYVRDVDTGECKATLVLGMEGSEVFWPFGAIAFSHDSELVAASNGSTIEVWMVQTGQRLRKLENYRWKTSGKAQSETYNLFFTNDSKSLFSDSNGDIRLWDLTSGTCTVVLESPNDFKHGFVNCHIQDLKPLVLSRNGSVCRIWNITQHQDAPTRLKHLKDPNSLVFCHEARVLASSSIDGSVHVWDAETGNAEEIPKGHPELWHVALAASSDSKRLVSASMFNEIWIWNLETGYCIAFLETSTRLLEISLLPGDGGLVTNAGIIPIDINAAGPFQLKAEFKGLGYSDEGWITWDGKPWFWLPRQYRRAPEDGPVQVQGNRIAIGCESGQVVFFGIDGGMGFEHGTNV
ncbi:hypothetical protein F5X68DRAFT_152953 [Plectosphaerella plurivora]|uniref:NACHT domain-containing protein n=1 Tax=Plectosphaerella plurivora TaxID=936078 RepID=A0A9P9AB45_9PEZI|nr:hypothetical protein F5X68DRAFT_152953 [Plectosphaerella plurivora]